MVSKKCKKKKLIIFSHETERERVNKNEEMQGEKENCFALGCACQSNLTLQRIL
jgi:hypothetical protein